MKHSKLTVCVAGNGKFNIEEEHCNGYGSDSKIVKIHGETHEITIYKDNKPYVNFYIAPNGSLIFNSFDEPFTMNVTQLTLEAPRKMKK